ncbi:hypothetical protein EVAR_22669_1 [Eumeta japonica]|uniref:Uncharacterized protein n=1 Tax=Eumeta variegata TaxID=151549 RepID=A0A4C1VLH0_EUMVA|nr:hypothetical protein EVAR_22669_1 [Eumeta japonica]
MKCTKTVLELRVHAASMTHGAYAHPPRRQRCVHDTSRDADKAERANERIGDAQKAITPPTSRTRRDSEVDNALSNQREATSD